jgi:uncharacterized Zn-finger protein
MANKFALSIKSSQTLTSYFSAGYPLINIEEVMRLPPENAEHQLTVVKQSENEFVCSFCRKLFKSWNSCKQHLDIHLGRTKCEICNFVCSRRGNLKAHMITKHGVKLF